MAYTCSLIVIPNGEHLQVLDACGYQLLLVGPNYAEHKQTVKLLLSFSIDYSHLTTVGGRGMS